MDKTVFFRNDDVRNNLDKELIQLTDLFIKHKLPICHAVEPANVSKEVVSWLKDIKKSYPDLIEIIQHGYDHNVNGKYHKMEFGGTRSYKSQYQDILKGKNLMDKYFGNSWAKIFTSPYGSYNKDTLKAIAKLDYLGISAGTSFISPKTIVKNKIGTLLNNSFLFGKRISYHNKQVNRFGIPEISTSISIIKEYFDEQNAKHKSINELKSEFEESQHYTKIIGVLFHHRFHTNQFEEIEALLYHIISKQYPVKTISEIIKLKSN